MSVDTAPHRKTWKSPLSEYPIEAAIFGWQKIHHSLWTAVIITVCAAQRAHGSDPKAEMIYYFFAHSPERQRLPHEAVNTAIFGLYILDTGQKKPQKIL